jgi:hypothetical protein
VGPSRQGIRYLFRFRARGARVSRTGAGSSRSSSCEPASTAARPWFGGSTSRILPDWDYIFLVDLEGHKTDENLARAITRLGEHSTMVKHLGSYPRASRKA